MVVALLRRAAVLALVSTAVLAGAGTGAKQCEEQCCDTVGLVSTGKMSCESLLEKFDGEPCKYFDAHKSDHDALMVASRAMCECTFSCTKGQSTPPAAETAQTEKPADHDAACERELKHYCKGKQLSGPNCIQCVKEHLLDFERNPSQCSNVQMTSFCFYTPDQEAQEKAARAKKPPTNKPRAKGEKAPKAKRAAACEKALTVLCDEKRSKGPKCLDCVNHHMGKIQKKHADGVQIISEGCSGVDVTKFCYDGGNGKCPKDTYEDQPATSSTGRVCKPVSVCGAGEYEAQSPTYLTDRVCGLLTTCNDDEVEVTAPTKTTDRECKEKGDKTKIEEVVEKAMGKMDRQSRACEDELRRYCKSDERDGAKCVMCVQKHLASIDKLLEWWKLHDCTNFQMENFCFNTDKKKTPCPKGFFEAQQATASVKQVCKPFTVCASDEYEAQAPTPETDRVCAFHTKECSGDKYEVAAPTKTSDRICGTREEKETIVCETELKSFCSEQQKQGGSGCVSCVQKNLPSIAKRHDCSKLELEHFCFYDDFEDGAAEFDADLQAEAKQQEQGGGGLNKAEVMLGHLKETLACEDELKKFCKEEEMRGPECTKCVDEHSRSIEKQHHRCTRLQMENFCFYTGDLSASMSLESARSARLDFYDPNKAGEAEDEGEDDNLGHWLAKIGLQRAQPEFEQLGATTVPHLLDLEPDDVSAIGEAVGLKKLEKKRLLRALAALRERKKKSAQSAFDLYAAAKKPRGKQGLWYAFEMHHHMSGSVAVTALFIAFFCVTQVWGSGAQSAIQWDAIGTEKRMRSVAEMDGPRTPLPPRGYAEVPTFGGSAELIVDERDQKSRKQKGAGGYGTPSKQRDRREVLV